MIFKLQENKENVTEEERLKNENKEKKNQLKMKLKEKVFEHLSTTHLHGLPHIVRSKYWYMKVIWVLMFCAFIIISSWLTSQAYTSYFAWPVVSSVSLYVEQQQLFPAVTICNLEPLITKFASDTIQEKLNPNFNYSLESLQELKNARSSILDKMSGNDISFSFKQSFGYSIDETLISCQFNGNDCMNTSVDFIWYYSFKYGNCYTFNSGYSYNTNTPNENSTKFTQPIKAVSRDDIDHGLNLEIYVGSRDAKYSLEKYGAIVFIHNQSSLPESSNGIFLTPGTQNSIGIEKSFNSYTPDPFSSCEDLSSYNFDRTYYNAIQAVSLSYSQSTCLDVCLRQQIIAQCGCSYMEFIQIKKAHPCGEKNNELDCAYNLFYNFWSENSYSVCSNFCPLECNTQTYSYTISTSGYPTDLYARALINNLAVSTHFNTTPSIDQIKEDVLQLNVHFSNDKYTYTTQSRQYYVYDLFSNTGGIFNLFLGLSIICLAQFLDFLFEMSMIIGEYIRDRHGKKSKKEKKISEEEALKQLVILILFLIISKCLNRCLTYLIFVTKKANRLKRENMTQEELVKYKAVFDEIDKDGNGVIDLAEYRASLFSSHLSKWQKIRAVIFFKLILY